MTKHSSLLDTLTQRFPAAAEYLIEIFIIERDYGIVKNSVIAERLGVTKPAVTQAMNRLKKYELIQQDLYRSIQFTDLGKELAEKLIRQHYLLELLMVKLLDYQWEKSDKEASRLQSSISDDFANYLYTRLGQPDTCPHGNPMPGSKKEKEILAAPRLTTAENGDHLEVVRITEEGEATEGLLDFCFINAIQPGTEFEVMDKERLTGITIKQPKGKTILIPHKIAKYICCTPVL